MIEWQLYLAHNLLLVIFRNHKSAFNMSGRVAKTEKNVHSWNFSEDI